MIKKIMMVFILSQISLALNAAESDVIRLDDQVVVVENELLEAGVFPTGTELESIKREIVAKEIETTTLTLEEAVKKYDLTDADERNIKIKQASMSADGDGGGIEPPK